MSFLPIKLFLGYVLRCKNALSRHKIRIATFIGLTPVSRVHRCGILQPLSAEKSNIPDSGGSGVNVINVRETVFRKKILSKRKIFHKLAFHEKRFTNVYNIDT